MFCERLYELRKMQAMQEFNAPPPADDGERKVVSSAKLFARMGIKTTRA